MCIDIYTENRCEATSNEIELQTSSSDTSSIIEQAVEHRFAHNGGARSPVAMAGQGRLLLFLHGFPDHWLTWHAVMAWFLKFHRVWVDHLPEHFLQMQ